MSFARVLLNQNTNSLIKKSFMKTLALVIGNDNYHKLKELTNAVNDATEIEKIFQKLGYDVILKTNIESRESDDTLKELEERIQNNKYDCCIFYFSGHGFEEKGENYLALIDTEEKYLERTSIRLNNIFYSIKTSDVKISILIIDACRVSTNRGSTSDSSRINVPQGSIIAFSTSPYAGASDRGFEKNSIYTGTLIKHLSSVKDYITVEELFKRVRKTVYDLSDGKQVTWEHTSLIDDFHFNIGQMIYDLDIPYNEKVVKDTYYEGNRTLISKIIMDLRCRDWNKQNPAIDKLESIKPNTIDKNDLFLIGRNILQSAEGNAFASIKFIENISTNLEKYFTEDNENHLLNGILFEMYFNHFGEFRKEHFKKYHFNTIFSLRKEEKYLKSFEFIHKVLLPYKDYLFYIPSAKREGNIDVNISAIKKEYTNFLGEEVFYQEVQSIKIFSKDIIDEIYQKGYSFFERDENEFKMFLSNFIFAPKELINIISNIKLTNIILRKKNEPDLPF